MNDSNNHTTNRRENANNTNDDDDDDDDEVYLNDDFNNYHDNNCNKVRIVEPYIPIDIVESLRIIMNMNIQHMNDNESSSSSVRNILNEKDYLVYLNTLSTIILSIEQVIKIYKKFSDDFLLYSNKVRQESVNSASITPTKGSSSSSDGSIQLIVQVTFVTIIINYFLLLSYYFIIITIIIITIIIIYI